MGDDRQAAAQYTQNETMTLRAKLNTILGAIEHREMELSAVLPPDITFQAFHATINQALRANPDLLTCTQHSVINACVKAGYDGLKVDGREAAIVWGMERINGKSEKTARYMPMYQGLVQQVLRGGMVLACEADVIYENDEYQIIRGSNPSIHHIPLLEGDRGRMIAAYNVATLPSGLRTTSYLTGEQIIDIQKESKSGWKDSKPAGVWQRWPREQWKKTILRQHRKTLPVGAAVIRDVEQNDEFPQFDRQSPHPQLASAPRPRPTRAAIANQQGTEAGVDMGFDPGTGEVVEQQQQRGQQQEQQQQKRADPPKEEARELDVELPEDDKAWAVWGVAVEKRIAAAKSNEECDAIRDDIRPVAQHASKAIQGRLTSVLTDRRADLALEGATGTAAGAAE